MLQNILWYIGQPPATKNYLEPNVNRAKVEKHKLEDQQSWKI